MFNRKVKLITQILKAIEKLAQGSEVEIVIKVKKVGEKMTVRKRRNPRAKSWELENLHPLYDWLTLQSGRIRAEHYNPKIRIRSVEDAEKAWRANRHHFLQMCSCHLNPPRCRDHALKYSPGRRPWGFWKFDMGYDYTPRDQAAELDGHR